MADGGRVARTGPGGDPGRTAGPRAGDQRRHRGRARAAAARFRSRRPDEVRGRSGHHPRRCPARRDPGRPGRHPGRQHRVAQVGDGDVARSSRAGGAGGSRPQRPADPAAARARRSGRHAEVRLRRGPAHPGAGQRPRDGRPGRARPGRDQLPPAGVRHHPAQPRRRARLGVGARPTGVLPTPGRPGRHRRRPAALLRPGAVGGHVRRGRVGPEGRRHPRRRGRGGGLGPAAGSRFARALGPTPGREAGGRADGHPGDQGRRGRRRLHPGPDPRQPGPRRDRARRRRHRPGHRTGPAAPRAA